METAQAHIAFFPTPGMGHLIPLIELAQILIQRHGFAITFIIPDDGSPNKPQKDFLKTFPAINSIFLPPPICNDLPEDAKIEIRIVRGVIGSIPLLCKVLRELKDSSRLSAFVVDVFGSLAFDAVKDLGIPLYLFFPCSAMTLSFALHLPELDEACTCEYRDLPEPVRFPGCMPVQGPDSPDMVQDRKNEAYELCLKLCNTYRMAEGILINGFLELEPDTFKALEQDGSSPIYPVGPLIRPCSGDISDDKAECLKWLDEQPAGSVLFVSFGSGGTLSTEQLKELTLGLEMSKQRFLFVARRPDDKVKSAAYFTGTKNETDHFEYLPAGFIERTQGYGFVLSHWAPQIEVLRHRAVGGFVTHCGWNSTLESIIHGVPMIAWPLYAEQKMNALLLSEDLKVAFRVRENENGVVDCAQISSLITSLMEGEGGEELRNRTRNLKDTARRALSQDGSSTKSLAIVAEKWKTEIAP